MAPRGGHSTHQPPPSRKPSFAPHREEARSTHQRPSSVPRRRCMTRTVAVVGGEQQDAHQLPRNPTPLPPPQDAEQDQSAGLLSSAGGHSAQLAALAASSLPRVGSCSAGKFPSTGMLGLLCCLTLGPSVQSMFEQLAAPPPPQRVRAAPLSWKRRRCWAALPAQSSPRWC